MTPADLRAELEGGRVRPAYLLLGSEPLLREDAQRAIFAAALPPDADEFSSDRLDGERTEPGELEDALRMLSVFGGRRVVLLREPEARRRGGLVEALATLVPTLREEDTGGTVLVVTAARADGRARWVKAFSEPAAVVRCEPPRAGKELLAFVREEAKRQGLELAPGAAEALAERVGPQLLLLRGELAKAALYAGPGEVVRPGHVAESVGHSADEPIWDLTDAIGAGRGPTALAVLRRMQEAGAPAPVVLGALATHFRKLLRLRAGGSVAGHPFAVRKLEQQARRVTLARLRGGLRLIHETDEALKGRGALPPELALERLVLALVA